MSIFLKIFFFQILAAMITISILKVILDRNLIESAVKQFEYLCQHSDLPSPPEVTVISCHPLSPAVSSRVRCLVRKKFGEGVNVRCQTDKRMWGGVVIRVPGTVVNYSLKDRVRQAVGKGPVS
ncbi:MAG TPA: F0F1 ATP synthase subunit delta [Candidatus Omnitrophota bacterium]|nr:F0F1 ATP synthase subunit delta [Candidatus Omnitrophota bacterium]HPB67652.1 F0F1 ATP synthase subunit delta [Candidatus Omnitrophota bacterium]HQO58454.1 F0F1 ATP synthase subunit delta [Candidatus Omnitrophota bacterium]HQP11559.1 F0F1 ATP synthase subunit delta [Candidatus Omnitrophota bacterium]